MQIGIQDGLLYQKHRFVKGDILIEDGRIRRIGPGLPEGIRVFCAQGLRVVPGFFDLHTHGAAGVDVNAARAEDLERVCRAFASHGTTGWLASILTDSREQTLRCIGEYRRWKTLPHRGARLEGLHLEGPFLSPQYRGAMPEMFLRRGDPALLREYQEAAGGDIRYLTVAPETEGVQELIPTARRLGIQVAVGHTGADYDTARQAFLRGARAATHMGNAMRLWHQREPAVFGAVLEEASIYAELICDGRHLHPGTVRLIVQNKGPGHILAVTDSIMAAGLPDGQYRLGVNDVTLEKGDARITGTDIRAGSVLSMDEALRNLMAFSHLPLEEALLALTENPARLLGLSDQLGFLEEGRRANLTFLDAKNHVVRTMADGEWLEGDDRDREDEK